MARPEDMRCEAKADNGGRCTGEKTFDPETGNWLRWCEEHQAFEVQARAEGGERVQRYEGAEGDEGSEDSEDE